MAESAARRGELLAADGWFARALAEVERVHDPEAQLVRGAALVASNRALEAHVVGQELVARADLLPACRARAWTLLVDAGLALGETRRAAADEALVLAQRSGDPLALVDAHLAAAWIARRMGSLVNPSVAAALDALRGVHEPDRVGNALWAAVMTGGAAALGGDLLRTAREAFVTAGLPFGVARVDALRFQRGEPVEPAALDEAEGVLQARGLTENLRFLWVQRGTVALVRAELDAARGWLDRAEPMVGPARRALEAARIVLELWTGDLPLAGRVAERVLADRPLPRARCVALLARAAVGGEPLRDLRAAWRTTDPPSPVSPLVGRTASLAADHLAATLGPDEAGAVVRTRGLAIRAGVEADRHADLVARAIAGGAPVPLGSFDLRRRIGAGGMGEVWRATDADGTGFSWAVKLVLPDRLGSRAAVDAFEREIRAVAALAHRHVVPIVDVGTAADPRLTGGVVPAGAPWYAMPLAEGSFAALRGRLAWGELRRALLAALAALGHAHAHGLFHLDVKPENLLFLDRLDPAGSLLLADFGQVRGEGEHALGGTPAYMAPEQFRRRRLGPETDLYALGGVAVDLATGSPPFGHAEVDALRRAHLHLEPPLLAPVIAVPGGFDDWVRWLLEKDPAARPGSAAAAAEALRALGDPVHASSGPFGAGAAATIELTPHDGFGDATSTASVVHPSGDDLEATLSRREPGRGLAALPADWWAFAARSSGAPSTPALLGLRRAGLVGQAPIRDHLWAALAEVVAGGSRAIVLEAPRGGGASRLAEWVGRAAVEAGVARLVEVGPVPGPSQDPIVAWVDDPTACDLDALVERSRRGGPLLVVVALRAGELTRRPDLGPALSALGGPLVVPPLGLEEVGELCASLVTLRPSAALAIAAASAGNPGYAVDLLRQCVRSEELTPSEAGWHLPERWDPPLRAARDEPLERGDGIELLEVAAALGTTSVQAWGRAAAALELSDPAGRVARWVEEGVLRAAPRDEVTIAHPALRDAVVGGAKRDGRWARWNRVCAEVIGGDAVRLGRWLLEADEPRLALPHLLVAVPEVARADGAAAGLAVVSTAWRAATLSGVREGDEAWSRLVQQEGWLLERLRDGHALRALCDRALEAWQRLGRPPPPGTLVVAGRAEWFVRDHERALLRFDEAARAADEEGLVGIVVRARIEQGRLLQELGRLDEALAVWASARAGGGRTPADEARLELVAGLGCLDSGRFEEARDHFTRAAREDSGVEPGARLQALQGLGDALRLLGDLDAADQVGERALALSAQTGTSEILCRTNLVLVALARGDVPEILRRLEPCDARRGSLFATVVTAILALVGLLLPSEAPWSARVEGVSRLLAHAPADRDLGWTAGRIATLLDARGAPASVVAWLRRSASRDPPRS